MHKPRKIAVMAACAALTASYAVNAADVANQAGTVLVSTGEGFVPIAADAEVAPVAQVMVQPGGLAKITYSNNCVVRVGSGLWLVQKAAPCANGTSEIDFTGRMNQAAPPEGEAPAGGGGINTTLLVVGGVVVAGGIAAVVIANNNSKPSSP